MKKLLPVAAAALCCLACTPPLYDAAMLEAARTIDRIPLAATIGPMPAPDLNQNGDQAPLARERLVFLPVWDSQNPGTFDVTQGFVIRLTGSGDRQVWYEWNDGTTTHWGSGTGYKQDSGIPWQALISLKPSGTAAPWPVLGMIQRQDYHLTWINHLWVDTGAMSPRVFYDYNMQWLDPAYQAWNDLFMPTDPNLEIVGLSVEPRPEPTGDRLHVLARAPGKDQYTEASADFSSGGWRGTVSPYTSPPFFWAETPRNFPLASMSPDLWPCIYYRDTPRGRSYVQWPGPDGWRTWAWQSTFTAAPSGFTELTGVTHRIDALLANGQLLSTDDDVGRVYGGDGALQAEFPLGTLELIGQVYYGAVPYVLFSRVLADGSSLKFEIRAIASAALATTLSAP